MMKDTIQDCNLNFLLGSGLSRPYLITLGAIEDLLTQLEQSNCSAKNYQLIRVSLYKKYFDGVIAQNPSILRRDAGVPEVLDQYVAFLKNLNSIMLRRKSTILSKEVNLFTTNIDIFPEVALEVLGLEFNDGFNGRFRPSFSLNNFKKSRFKKSLHYDNISEIPVFNLLKLHGSLSWRIEPDQTIGFSCDLADVENLKGHSVSPDHILEISDKATITDLITAASTKKAHASTAKFTELYEKFLIVNPTKEKFKHTLLNQNYYELLRLYSNELEKENTVLFVLGFSFADEHIRDITLRAASSNPTLIVYVVAHSTAAKSEIEKRFGANNIKNNNIVFISPPQEDVAKGGGDKFNYDFAAINREIFGSLFKDDDGPAISPPKSISLF
jgi:SIR2-like domain